jgi:hypothetical protein
MRDIRNVYKILIRKFEKKRSFGTLDVDMEIILKGTLNKEGIFLHLDQKRDK